MYKNTVILNQRAVCAALSEVRTSNIAVELPPPPIKFFEEAIKMSGYVDLNETLIRYT
jgi:hypothetical protein